MKNFSALLLAFAVAGAGQAQVVIDNFNTGTVSGAVIGGSSWVGQVTQNATTITVGGTANDDNGFGTTSASLNATGMNFLTITAQRDAGNATSTLAIQFEDTSLNTQVYSIATSAFNVGSLTTVNIALGWVGFDSTQITGWNIGGGGITTTGPDFAMTFDNMSFTTAAIPEPSTYAAIFGALALGLAAYRRRARAV